MKARVIATGKIVEVIAISDYINENGQIIGEYKDVNGILYTSYDLDFYIEEGITIPNYWTRLEHTYAGMAMQGILSCPEWNIVPREGVSHTQECALQAQEFAHALVEKMKEKEER